MTIEFEAATIADPASSPRAARYGMNFLRLLTVRLPKNGTGHFELLKST
jgi:hypothetical protein